MAAEEGFDTVPYSMKPGCCLKWIVLIARHLASLNLSEFAGGRSGPKQPSLDRTIAAPQNHGCLRSPLAQQLRPREGSG